MKFVRTDRLYFWGGASLLVVAILFILITILTLALLPSLEDLYPTAPLTGKGLGSLAQHAMLARVTLGSGILSALFLIPGIVALYAALKGAAEGTMLVASLFMGLYVILDLAVTGINAVALVSISQDYVTGSAAAQQSIFAVASYIKDLINVSLPLSSAVLSIGILLTGLILLKGPFGRAVAYLAIGSGIVGRSRPSTSD